MRKAALQIRLAFLLKSDFEQRTLTAFEALSWL
jgi:hypothetical protein